MKYATHGLSLAIFGSAFIAASASCSGPAAGVAEFSSGGVSGAATTSGGSGDDDTNSSSTSSTSGAAAPTDFIFGTQAFAFTPPPENADDHTTGTHTGLVPMEGKACVVTGCHLAGAQPWVLAGTVYSAATGGPFTGQAEIGIVTPDNKGTLVYTDKQGNFWLETGDPPAAGSFVGIRIAGGKTIPMATGLPAAPGSQNCNEATACHGQANLRIYVQ